MTTAAIYCRVSTEWQKEEEIPILGQIEECRKYASEHGLEVVAVYKDEGYSGRTDERPAFQEMIAAVKQTPKLFYVILSWRSNRLFRSVEHRLAYSRILRRYGIKFISLHEPEFEGATAQFMETVLAAADELYARQIGEDTLRGLKQIARKGFSTGGRPPTGYRNVRVVAGGLRPNGEPVMRTRWESDLAVAPRLLKAFELCAQGATNVEIMTATRIVSSKSSLSSLLRNRAYLGERIYNTTRRTDKKTIRLKNPPDQVVIVPNSHPAIVPEELFNRVQVILDHKRPKAGQIKYTRRHYILSGLLWCKQHNEPYSGQTNGPNAYYACAVRKRLGKKAAPCPYLKKEAVEKFILDNVKAYVFTHDRVKQGLEALAKEAACNRQEDDTEYNRVLLEIKQVDIELERLHVAITQGVMASSLAKPINEREQKRSLLEKQLEGIEKVKERAIKLPVITEAMVDDVLTKVRAMLDSTNPQELKTALAHFIDRIEVQGSQLTLYYSVAASQNIVYCERPRGDSNP